MGTDPATLSFGGDGWELSEYNGFNQLVSTLKDGVEVTYAYKPDGLRLSKTTNGATTTHIWDGQNIVAELEDESVAAVYLRGINLIKNLADNTYYSFNAHGDVVQLTNSSGAVTKDYRYDAFGVEQDPDEGDANVWRYCGEYWDGETGTIYLRARYYDPVIGRFTQQDTTLARRKDLFDPYGDYQETSLVGGVYKYVEKEGDEPSDKQKGKFVLNDPLSLNLYTYCYNSPMMFADPDGHFVITLSALAVGAFVAGVSYVTYRYISNQIKK